MCMYEKGMCVCMFELMYECMYVYIKTDNC